MGRNQPGITIHQCEQKGEKDSDAGAPRGHFTVDAAVVRNVNQADTRGDPYQQAYRDKRGCKSDQGSEIHVSSFF